ncbi:hypothetical protein C1O66_21730 [Paucibacter aquatile]|uniref:Uncharacterized protein n=1 Tax=Kinneretia aquatilis TaxID=2070761 RepID=A0A2N8KS90_9BURK|nr:hypothetical protein C1O66_21730 [Paucibacter aquatile]
MSTDGMPEPVRAAASHCPPGHARRRRESRASATRARGPAHRHPVPGLAPAPRPGWARGRRA